MTTPLKRLERALGEVVLGQSRVLEDLLTTFLARGHVLLEGVPGGGQDAHGPHHGERVGALVRAHSVHA